MNSYWYFKAILRIITVCSGVLLFPVARNVHRKCVLVINPKKSKTSEAKGGMTPLEADERHQERPWRARGVFCLTIFGFSTKSQPEILLVSSNKPALTLPTMWMVSTIYFTPFWPHQGQGRTTKTDQIRKRLSGTRVSVI